jgi:lycopene cyclase domain-containing protein
VKEYTLLACLAAALVVVAELAWLRTGIFRLRAYWVTMAIVGFFQVLVDGWLTKLSAPIVVYNVDQFGGWRFPFDIPVEDFAFGFALVTGAILLWERDGRRAGSPTSQP